MAWTEPSIGVDERGRVHVAAVEFAAWDAAGLLESRVIDGNKLYFNRAPSNLFRLSAEARARRAVSR